MPPLETARLVIRPFVHDDLTALDRVLQAAWNVRPAQREAQRARHESYLRWLVLNHIELAALDQPPYGERAICLRSNGMVIGSVGVVPSLLPFGLLPGYPVSGGSPFSFPEVGLYWAIDPAQQRQGYATEAARAVVDFAFAHLNLARIVATTEYDNEASMAVMGKLGMQILRNPTGEPPWLQVVGLLNHP